MILEQKDWERAKKEAESNLKQAEMIRVTSQMLLDMALQKLQEMPKKKDGHK